jgi:hypothetical protein
MFDPLEGLENETVGTWTQQTSATVSEHGSSNAGKSGRNNFRGIRTTIPYRLTGDLAAPPPAVSNLILPQLPVFRKNTCFYTNTSFALQFGLVFLHFIQDN